VRLSGSRHSRDSHGTAGLVLARGAAAAGAVAAVTGVAPEPASPGAAAMAGVTACCEGG